MAAFLNNIGAKIQKIPNKNRLYGFLGFLAVLLILFVWQVHIPMRSRINELQKDIAGLQSTIAANDEKIKKLDQLRAEVKSLEARLKLLTEQLPPGSEVSGLLRQIQNLVSESGLTLKLWRPGTRKVHSSGLYEEIPISLELSGPYHDTAMFFDRVSNLTRIVNMRNLKMGSATISKAGTMDIKISCTAMTFAAVEKKPDAAGTKK